MATDINKTATYFLKYVAVLFISISARAFFYYTELFSRK